MMIVIVLGTGRCGITTTAKFINSQKNVTCTDEARLLPWKVNHKKLLKACAAIQSQCTPTRGDAAFYYLPYCERISKLLINVRFVCVRLKKRKVIDGFLASERNYFRGNKKKWDRCLPTYIGMSHIDALSRYYDEYYEQANKLSESLPFQIFDVEKTLNTELGKKNLLQFLDILDRKAIE